jgi:hypothetical protein
LPAELFPRLARNAPLLLTIGSVGLTFGLLLLVGAIGIAFKWEAPLAKAVAGVVFFLATLFLTPSIHLLYYRIEILNALSTPSPESLAKVLRQQVRFWRFVGVAAILWMAMIATSALLR